jgi:hypothetical protein
MEPTALCISLNTATKIFLTSLQLFRSTSLHGGERAAGGKQMSTERSKFEGARKNVPNAWNEIVSITDRSMRFGFKALAVRLLVLKINEGQHNHKISCTALESDIAKRLEQIQNAFTETADLTTIPVGVIVVGKTTDGTNRGIDEIVLVTDAVAAAAEIANSDVEAVTDALSDGGAAFASTMLLGPNGGYDVITEIR